MRRWDVHFRGFRKGCSFRVNGQAAQAAYDPQTNTYTVTLTDVAAAEGATVTVHHDTALIHDDSDCFERIMDAITRAQIPQRTKELMKLKYDGALDHMAKGLPLTSDALTCDGEPYLGGCLYELLAQQ